MNIINVIIAFLCLHSSVLSHDQENDSPLYNEHFMKNFKPENIYFLESFNNKESFLSTWTVSQALKATEDGGTLKYDGDWTVEEAMKDSLPNDVGLTFKEKAKHRAISSKLYKDFVFYDKPFILQYEVLHQDGQECGGAYLKLLSKQSPPVKPLSDFNDKTPYTIMFGPDKCGAVNKLHFIFRHKNPLNGSLEEKHSKPPKSKIDESFTDAKPHLFKLIIKPDNTFSVSMDHKIINDGSLLEDFNPPVNPPLEIDDPTDKKPSDWDDREKIHDPLARKPENWDETAPYQIPDPNAVKPEDWLEDEPVNISDPSAEKPDDWDNEMDGEWEAPLVPNPVCEDVSGCGPWSPPLINNPEYRGKWVAPLINNPDYRGVWTPRKIPNPNYFEDRNPFQMSSIDSLGFELWSMSAKILFDNVIITDDDTIAKQFAALTFDRKIVNIEKSAETIWAKMMVWLNHKPGWWSLYFLYCFIPISIYVWYLWRRVKEDTILNQFIAFTNQYPWLWALYVVILLIPVTLIVVCCFWTTKDTEGEHKKDDDKPQESDVNSSLTQPPSLVGESKEGEDKREENQDNISENKEHGAIKTDVSDESHLPEPQSMSVNKEGETYEKMVMTSEGTENEPEFVLKQRKQYTSTH